MSNATVLAPAALLTHWQGHRALTRRLIDVFPEDQLFSYSIGGMRPFGALAGELLGMAVPIVKEIVGGASQAFSDAKPGSKEEILAQWDASTAELNEWFAKIPDARFGETVTIFGQYTGTVWSQLFYAIDNEIHHRGQGYVYLRALGIEPPPFWERGDGMALATS
jgi:uncharacterized damage-inducible protein DinB